MSQSSNLGEQINNALEDHEFSGLFWSRFKQFYFNRETNKRLCESNDDLRAALEVQRHLFVFNSI